MTLTLIISILGAVQGMFQFGYNTGVMNAPGEIIKDWIANVLQTKISDDTVKQWFAFMVSAFPVGGMIGALIVPSYCATIGPKKGLLISNLLSLGSALLMVLAKNYHSLVGFTIGRALIGFYSALCMALVPLYLSEISPTNLRGAIGTLSQLAVTVGLFLAQIFGQPYIFGSSDNWIWLFVIVFIPSVAQLVLLSISPESPRYLLIVEKQQDESVRALIKLRGQSAGDLVEEIESINREEENFKAEKEKYGEIKGMIDIVKRTDIQKALVLGMIMHMSQQITGINAVFYYSTSIFSSAGFSHNVAAQTTSVIGIIMITMTLISVPLMDKLGRRTLHLTGLGGMFMFSILLTIALQLSQAHPFMKVVNVASVMSFTIFFAIGPGSIPFTIMGELFTQSSRARAVCLCVFVNWFCNFIIAITFPIIQPILGNYVFIPFTLLLALFWVYLYFSLPETKNRTFEEIAALFTRDQPARQVDYTSLAQDANDLSSRRSDNNLDSSV